MALMKIECPECGFNKEIDSSSIPATAKTVTCPKCKQKFPFLAAETAKPKAVIKPEIDEILPDYFFLKPEKSKFKGLISKISSKLTMKRIGLIVGLLLIIGCFVCRPFFVVLPELKGKILQRNLAVYPVGGDRLLNNEGNPVANSPVYLFAAIRRPVLIKFGDGSMQPEVVSDLRYYTYTDDKGNIRIPGTIAVKLVFGTFLHRFYVDEVRIVVLNKTQDGHLVDSNLPLFSYNVNTPREQKYLSALVCLPKNIRPYNVYTSRDQKYFDDLNNSGVKPLSLSDRLQHMKSGQSKSWWSQFKEWIWGKEWDLS